MIGWRWFASVRSEGGGTGALLPRSRYSPTWRPPVRSLCNDVFCQWKKQSTPSSRPDIMDLLLSEWVATTTTTGRTVEDDAGRATTMAPALRNCSARVRTNCIHRVDRNQFRFWTGTPVALSSFPSELAKTLLGNVETSSSLFRICLCSGILFYRLELQIPSRKLTSFIHFQNI